LEHYNHHDLTPGAIWHLRQGQGAVSHTPYRPVTYDLPDMEH